MKKTMIWTLCALMMASLTACKDIKTPNGQVPAEYLGLVQTLEGSYVGSFNGHEGTLKIVLDGDRPVLSFEDGANNDLLGPDCRSTIGHLKMVRVRGNKQNPRVSLATFEFDPNLCRTHIQGRTLELGLKEKNGSLMISAQIFERTELVTVPGTPGTCNSNGIPVPCPNPPHTEARPVYLDGHFTRQ